MDDDSNNQRTALHEATEGGHADVAELLLKQSEVDPTVRDTTDNTPYDIAYSKKNEEVSTRRWRKAGWADKKHLESGQNCATVKAPNKGHFGTNHHAHVESLMRDCPLLRGFTYKHPL